LCKSWVERQEQQSGKREAVDAFHWKDFQVKKIYCQTILIELNSP
jgi:hypothetical protein